MTRTRLTVERRGPAAWLILEEGEGHALSEALLTEIAAALGGLADDSGTRAAVLVGADRVFCRGWEGVDPGDGEAPARLSSLVQQVAEAPLPLIAAVSGDALGAGLVLALACDVRLADDAARFGFPEQAAGLLPLGGGAARLARAAGRAAALRLLLTGEPLDAAEALACGLVSGVYPRDRLHAEAQRLAEVIASRGPIAVRYAKEAVSRGVEMPLEQALRFETDLTIILQSTADRAEGVRAFAEKRTPRFGGQ